MGQEPGHPSATNMKKLQWSSELARVAQRWADQCPEYHDKNRRVLEFKQQPGQNMATAWNSRNDPDYELERKIQSWYDEVSFLLLIFWGETLLKNCLVMIRLKIGRPMTLQVGLMKVLRILDISPK